MDLQREKEGRRKDNMIKNEEIDRIKKSVNLAIGSNACTSNRGSGDMLKRIDGLEESLKKANNERLSLLKKVAKQQEIVQELKEKFFYLKCSLFASYILHIICNICLNFRKLSMSEVVTQRDDLQNKVDKYQEINIQNERWKKRCDEFRDLNEDIQHKIDDVKEELDIEKFRREKEKQKLEDQVR